MSNTVAIDGVSGPGRKTVLITTDVTEVTFRLGKKVIEVIEKNGNMGQYDLAQAASVRVDNIGDEFLLAITAKEEAEEKDERTPEERTRDEASSKKKAELLKKIGEITREYGGLESNIPLQHEYWTLLNQYREKKT